MIKSIFLREDGSVFTTSYCPENREEQEFMTKHPLGDGTGYRTVPKKLGEARIKMYEQRFPIKIRRVPNSKMSKKK